MYVFFCGLVHLYSNCSTLYGRQCADFCLVESFICFLHLELMTAGNSIVCVKTCQICFETTAIVFVFISVCIVRF